MEAYYLSDLSQFAAKVGFGMIFIDMLTSSS